MLALVDVDLVRHAGLAGELDALRLIGEQAGAEALGLLAHLLHQLGAHDALGKPGKVLDLGRLLQQAAPGEALDQQRVQVRTRGVKRRPCTPRGRCR